MKFLVYCVFYSTLQTGYYFLIVTVLGVCWEGCPFVISQLFGYFVFKSLEAFRHMYLKIKIY